MAAAAPACLGGEGGRALGGRGPQRGALRGWAWPRALRGLCALRGAPGCERGGGEPHQLLRFLNGRKNYLQLVGRGSGRFLPARAKGKWTFGPL